MNFFFSGKIYSFLIFYFPGLNSSKQLNCAINDSHTNYFYESTYTTVVHCGNYSVQFAQSYQFPYMYISF